MIDRARRRRLIGMVLFAALCLATILARLLPLSPGSVGWPGPDLILCLAFAWVLRRPEQAPVLLIAALVLAEDVLLLRPPGLAAALTVIATEAARLRTSRWREHGFVVEWLGVSGLIGGIWLAARLLQVMLLLPVPPLGQELLRWLATAGAYPLVALAVWGVTRRGPALAAGEASGG